MKKIIKIPQGPLKKGLKEKSNITIDVPQLEKKTTTNMQNWVILDVAMSIVRTSFGCVM